ncbi:formyltransferase family protein [Campylobacter coli]|uniref:formyltransferase family protein n=1 Tax=Campylobacter coli TaxID=195 RepID=UPI000AEC6466|nr:formyltransferase family protein [Campylobacter coli]
MKFKKYIVVGESRVALKCQKVLENFFNDKVELIKSIDAKDEILNAFKDCLIISVHNRYIFKAPCIEKNTIINCHSALLPKHKGMNARIWAIYEGDEKSGITWHKVDYGIDTGDILVQKEIDIDETTTSLKLLNLQHELAANSLQECLENYFKNKTTKQNNKNGGGDITIKRICQMEVI